jgi:hypothetical protein
MYVIVLNDVSSFGTKSGLTTGQRYWLCPSLFVVASFAFLALSNHSITSSDADCGRF